MIDGRGTARHFVPQLLDRVLGDGLLARHDVVVVDTPVVADMTDCVHLGPERSQLCEEPLAVVLVVFHRDVRSYAQVAEVDVGGGWERLQVGGERP